MNKKPTMKQLPEGDKPYEKCIAQGAEALTDTELLAVILRTGTSGEPATDLARRILYSTGEVSGLLGLHRLSLSELKQLRGIGTVKAVQIKCIAELSRRMAKEKASARLSFRDPESIVEYYMEDLRHADQEEILVLMLDTKSRLIAEECIAKGTVKAAMITPREIFLRAFQHHAVYIILVHNHPSGDPTPSREDRSFTARVKQAGELLGIELLDHIVIGDQCAFSFRQMNLLS